MKIYHYDDKYAGENGVNGVKELLAAVCIGCAGTLSAATLMGLEKISVAQGLLLIGLTVAVGGVLVARLSSIVTASMSVLLEDNGTLYYLTVTPNLRGSSIPRSVSALLAGSSATYAENSLNARVAASHYAQNDEIVAGLFRAFQDDKIKTTFDTLMYGKPVRVCELLDRDFARTRKGIYRVRCLKNKKRRAAVRIPRAFPAFFG